MASVKALLGVLLLVGAGYLAFAFIPPYFTNYQLRDDINTIAKFAGVNTRNTEEDIRNDVMRKVREYQLPIVPEQVRVSRDERSVTISVDYTVVVDLVGGKRVPIKFHAASNK
jgi:hypothetical protein